MGINEVIYRGLKLASGKCKYFQVKEGTTNSVVQDLQRSVITVTYTPGSTSGSLSKLLGIPKVGSDLEMVSMPRPVLFPKTTVTLNGLRFKKLTYDSHTIRFVIVADSESRVSQDYTHTTIVVSQEDYKDSKFIDFLLYSGNLHFIKPEGPKIKGWEIRNFPKIPVNSESLNLESDSEIVYYLRKRYDDYVIRSIDYLDQFILEVRRILDDYGIELVRLNKERALSKTSYITYQFIQTPVKQNHPKYADLDENIMQHKQPMEFVFHCADMVMFHDFKNKYSNVNLLTNFCEFKTTDRYGDRWTAAVKWERITEEFSHTYSQDDNSNFAYQCMFRCELYFYECLDRSYRFLDAINTELEATNIHGSGGITINNNNI